MRLLLVEDEVNLAEALAEILKRNNYDVECVHDGRAGLHLAMSGIFDIILLDVMLPKLTGFEVLKKLRKSDRTTPVILLTARDGVSDKITGLDYGADDYLPKPFNTDELLARIRAAIRRKSGNIDEEKITFADTTLFSRQQKMVFNGREVLLSDRESKMATYFFKNETVIMPYANIIESVWEDELVSQDTVQKYVGFLIKKLQFVHSTIEILEIRGIGYKLIPQGVGLGAHVQ